MQKASATSSAYTAGPWHVELNPDGNPFVTNEDRQHVCVLCTHLAPSVVVANALLIAAAPALLAAARLVVDRWAKGDLAEAVNQLADAIAAATDE